MATAVDAHEAPARARTGRWSPGRWAPPAGLAAVVGAVLLPFAPVQVETPTVTWPVDAAAPRSTLLPATAQRPLGLDVRFGCETARSAGGVVLATVLPGSPEAATTGLVVTATDGRVRVRAQGRTVVDEAVPAGPCTYRVRGEASGRPVHVAAPPSPATRFDPGVPAGRAEPDPGRFAGPADAWLRVSRDGAELATDHTARLPEVAALVTDVGAVPVDSGLSVTLRLDDESASTPAPLKVALLAVVLAALPVTAVLLLLSERGPPAPRRVRFAPPRPVDVLVPGALLLWLVVAPATDDDGYFATQARNAAHSGDIGHYFQLYDQSVTPFTWVYQGLSAWQQVAGYAPVVQRLPALAAGLLTWFVARRVLTTVLGPGSRRRDAAARGALAVAFLAWWLPYDMGVRPEPVVALCAVVALHLVLVAGTRERLAPAWGACAVAGAGVVAHPGGAVALAPLVAGLPLLARCVRVPDDRVATALRALAAGSGLATALVLGFADGALRDVLRGQLVTESIFPQDGWAEELERYAFLLDQIPMGSYAKRAAVLACLLALAWFAVLAPLARRAAVPTPLLVTGGATALGFAALAITPSKWTHHFGSLAGVGAVFLAAVLVLAVPLARTALGGSRFPLPALLVAAASVVLAAALTWRGPNSWPYARLDGMPSPYRPPAPAGIALDSPLLWALVLVAVALVLARRHGPGPPARPALLRAVPAVLALSLAASTTHLLATFTASAAAGTPRDSVWAGSFADPTGASCVVGDALHVYDPFTARPLPGTGPATTGDVFVPGGGFYPANRPQGTAARQVWGSHAGRAGRPADEPTGTMTTGAYRLPQGGRVLVIAAGTLDRGNSLRAVYAAGSATVGTEQLTDSAASPSWRTFVLTPPAGADSVRVEAVDALAGTHGWLAFSAPVEARPVPVSRLVPRGAPVALAWQVAFGFPCLRPATVAHGVTEPPAFGVLRAPDPLGGLGDSAWQAARGGAFAQVPHTRSVLQLATVAPADPHLQVYAFGTPLARDAYTLTTAPRTVAGASSAVR